MITRRAFVGGAAAGAALAATVPAIAFAPRAAAEPWLVCVGQAVSRQTYKKLFAVLGDTYGEGDGVETFNLPDYSTACRSQPEPDHEVSMVIVTGEGEGSPLGAAAGCIFWRADPTANPLSRLS